MEVVTQPATTDQSVGSHLVHRFRAMAGWVTVHVVEPAPHAAEAVERVQKWFAEVERSCTRFDPGSDLMQANGAGRRWHRVGRTCFDALASAHRAYQETEGRFDPRTLESLTALGYDRSLDFAGGGVSTEAVDPPAARRVRRWRPRFDEARGAVRVGPRPVDLGGIGKGLAVRGGLAILLGRDPATEPSAGPGPAGTGLLVEAGGDLATWGLAPDGARWRAAVEDPFGGADPVAVLDVVDAAVATSSIRLRAWVAGGRRVHHLIDPRTGQPAESGLRSVTVLAADPAVAEVWSKTLFLAGRGRIRAEAEARGLAALWVDDNGRVGLTSTMRPRAIWKVTHVC